MFHPKQKAVCGWDVQWPWSRPCPKEDTAPGGTRLVTRLGVSLSHPWVGECDGDGAQQPERWLCSCQSLSGKLFAGHRLETGINCTEAKLGLDGTRIALPEGFLIITATFLTSDIVILIYMIYGNTGGNDSSIYKQD